MQRVARLQQSARWASGLVAGFPAGGAPTHVRSVVVAIVPDTKDWTWVLERACPDCGFDASAHARADVSIMVRRQADAWSRVLERDDVPRRPHAGVWSPLEYACHVRDVFELYDE